MADTGGQSVNEGSGHVVTVGGPVDKVKVSLRVFGDDLDPDEVTRVLKCEPSSATRKGDIIGGRAAGTRPVARTGIWLLSSAEDESVDLEAQVRSLLSLVSGDFDVWKELTQRYKVDLFCGLFLDDFNRGFVLSSALLKELSERNLQLVFDIYTPVSSGE